MDKKISVIRIIYDAIRFVLSNWGECIFRALPILFLIALVSYLQHVLGGIFNYTAKLVEPFLYAMFAVSWHRYSVLTSERNRKGLPYRFGLREIKFGALSVASTLLFVFLLQSLAALLPAVAAVSLFLVILVPVLLTLIFVYPAIALDQPVHVGLFFKKSIRQLVSFFIAFIIVCLVVLAIGGLIFLILPFLANIISAEMIKLLTFVVTQLVITPIFLALIASSASFLYRDVIGLDVDDQISNPLSTSEPAQDQ